MHSVPYSIFNCYSYATLNCLLQNITFQDAGTLLEPRAAAAVGQSGLMSLYDAMFAQYGVKIAQVLVTKPDFYNEQTRSHLFSTLSELISLNIVPIINTNDAVSPPPQVDEPIGGKQD